MGGRKRGRVLQEQENKTYKLLDIKEAARTYCTIRQIQPIFDNNCKWATNLKTQEQKGHSADKIIKLYSTGNDTSVPERAKLRQCSDLTQIWAKTDFSL